MVEFTNTNNFLVEEKAINIRFKEYKIKVPTVKDWLIVQSLDLNSENIERATLEKIVELFIIGYPKEKINELIDLELYGIATECFGMFKTENGEHQEYKNKYPGIEERDDITKVNLEFLVSKICKNYSLTINDVLEMPYHHFLILIRGLDIVNAEETLKYCEATHVYLKSDKGVEAYKKMISKYENCFEKGVEISPSQKQVTKDLIKLKEMLEGKKIGGDFR